MNYAHTKYLTYNAIAIIITLWLIPLLQKASTIFVGITTAADGLHNPLFLFLLKTFLVLVFALLLLRWLVISSAQKAIRSVFYIALLSYSTFIMIFPHLPVDMVYYGDINRWINLFQFGISELELAVVVVLFVGSWVLAKGVERWSWKALFVAAAGVIVGMVYFLFSSEYRMYRMEHFWKSVYANFHLLSSEYFLLHVFIALLMLVLIAGFTFSARSTTQRFERYLLRAIAVTLLLIVPMGMALFIFGFQNNIRLPFNSYSDSSLIMLSVLLGMGISLIKQNPQPQTLPLSPRLAYTASAILMVTALTLAAATSPVDLSHRGTIVDRDGNILAKTEVDIEYKRIYPYGNSCAHVVGYAAQGRVKQTVLGKNGVEEQYVPFFFKGKAGLEKVYEASLLNNDTVETTLDARLQQKLYELMTNKAGVLIVMDATNGELFSAVSAPSYDPNLFTTKISRQDWSRIIHDPKKPFYDRVSNGLYSSAGLIKPLDALAMLEHNISAQQRFTCKKDVMLGEHLFKSSKEIPKQEVNMSDALALDCETYFYQGAINVKAEALAEIFRRFGLGRVTGVDLPNEFKGTVPNPTWKQHKFNQPWYSGDTLNLAAGQGPMLQTPLQMTRMMAGLATGKLVTPHFNLQSRFDNQDINVSHTALQVVRSGLERSFSKEGYLGALNLPNFAGSMGEIAIAHIDEQSTKDMTPEAVEKLKIPHHVISAYFPKKNPKYVITLLEENSDANETMKDFRTTVEMLGGFGYVEDTALLGGTGA